jgi:signal recognition particle GTPase
MLGWSVVMLKFKGSKDLHKIVVLNPKGGSGKTTLAFNLAGYLASAGRKVAHWHSIWRDISRQPAARLRSSTWIARDRVRVGYKTGHPSVRRFTAFR